MGLFWNFSLGLLFLMGVTFEVKKQVYTGRSGIESLISLNQEIEKIEWDTIWIDFSKNNRFDANLLAILWSILDLARWKQNNIKLINLKDKQRFLFKRNNFLTYFWEDKLRDFNKTTIEYRKFVIEQIELFVIYINNWLLTREGIPELSLWLKKEISRNIVEIYNNAQIHWESDNVICCGQYFPKKGMLKFTIVNTGYSIHQKVEKFLGQSITSEDAIEWAVTPWNSTKKWLPWGLGYQFVRAFLRKNWWELIVSSGSWFWQEDQYWRITKWNLNWKFPWTIVSFTINMNDNKSYILKSEVHDLF